MLTILVDSSIMCMGLLFLGNLVVQVLSVFRLVRFLAATKMMRVCLSSVALLLSIIYMHEVFWMLSNYWGYPAFTMTFGSYDGRKIINSSPFCLFD